METLDPGIRAAAEACLAEFSQAMTAFQVGGPEPDYRRWAFRLQQQLGRVLDVLGGAR